MPAAKDRIAKTYRFKPITVQTIEAARGDLSATAFVERLVAEWAVAAGTPSEGSTPPESRTVEPKAEPPSPPAPAAAPIATAADYVASLPDPTRGRSAKQIRADYIAFREPQLRPRHGGKAAAMAAKEFDDA